MGRAKRFLLLRRVNFSSVEEGLLLLAAIAIFFIMLLTVSDVTGRYVFIRPVPGTAEISELVLVIIIFLGLSGTHRVGGHIGMEAVTELLKRKKRLPLYHAFESFNAFLSLILWAIIAYYFFQATLVSQAMDEISCGPLYISIWPFKLCIAIGSTFICVRLVIQLVQLVKSMLEHRLEAEA
jgi:TRAP-type C4-dicarboxylate transport system permease small subunit